MGDSSQRGRVTTLETNIQISTKVTLGKSLPSVTALVGRVTQYYTGGRWQLLMLSIFVQVSILIYLHFYRLFNYGDYTNCLIFGELG